MKLDLRHLKGMRSILSKVCEDLGERQLNEITREAIEEWQAEQDDVTLNTRISYARHYHILRGSIFHPTRPPTPCLAPLSTATVRDGW
jgi:hypothetical protein